MMDRMEACLLPPEPQITELLRLQSHVSNVSGCLGPLLLSKSTSIAAQAHQPFMCLMHQFPRQRHMFPEGSLGANGSDDSERHFRIPS